MTAGIVATGHWNSALPLVRYRTGDVAVLPPGTSKDDARAIAKGDSPFLGILGRSDDYITGADNVRYLGLNHVPWNLEDVNQVQIIQVSAASIRILVRARGELTPRDHNQILNNAREILPSDVDIEVVQTTELQRAANGKTPFIIRCDN